VIARIGDHALGFSQTRDVVELHFHPRGALYLDKTAEPSTLFPSLEPGMPFIFKQLQFPDGN
jgi:hypothetical protein